MTPADGETEPSTVVVALSKGMKVDGNEAYPTGGGDREGTISISSKMGKFTTLEEYQQMSKTTRREFSSKLTVSRFFGIGNEKNEMENLPLAQDMNWYSLKQVQTRYVVVSMEQQLEFFDIISMTRINVVKIGKFFSAMIRVNPPDTNFLQGDKFVQETDIGYYAKSFTNSAAICLRSSNDV